MDFLSRTGEIVKPFWDQVDKEAFTKWGTAAAFATGVLLGVKIISNIYLPEILVDLTTCGQILIVARLIQYVIVPLIKELGKSFPEYKTLIDKAALLFPVVVAVGATKVFFQVKSWITFTLFGFVLSFAVHEFIKPFIIIEGEAAAS